MTNESLSQPIKRTENWTNQKSQFRQNSHKHLRRFFTYSTHFCTVFFTSIFYINFCISHTLFTSNQLTHINLNQLGHIKKQPKNNTINERNHTREIYPVRRLRIYVLFWQWKVIHKQNNFPSSPWTVLNDTECYEHLSHSGAGNSRIRTSPSNLQWCVRWNHMQQQRFLRTQWSLSNWVLVRMRRRLGWH